LAQAAGWVSPIQLDVVPPRIYVRTLNPLGPNPKLVRLVYRNRAWVYIVILFDVYDVVTIFKDV